MSRTRNRSRSGSRESESSEKRSRSSLKDALKKDEERAKKRRSSGGMPFRFWQKKGEDCEVIILDESIEDAFWRHEHNIKGPDGKWGNFEPCIAESGPCPFCEEGSNPALVVFLTVLVMRPYTVKKTGETKEYSKMLLALKRGQYAEFEKIEKIAMKKNDTLRGTSIILERKDEENSFSTGMPVPNDDGQMINDFLSEDDLIDEFGHDAVEGRESGKILKQENEDIMAFDYRKLMPEPDADAIREEHGIEVSGSRRQSEKAREDDADEDDDDIPYEHEGDEERERSRSSRSSRSRSRGKSDDEDDKPTRTRSRSRRKVKDDAGDDEPEFDQ